MFTLKKEPQDPQLILQQGFLLYKKAFLESLPYVLIAGAFIFFLPWVLGLSHPLVVSKMNHDALHLFIFAIYSVGWLGLMSALLFRLYCKCYEIPNSFLGSFKHISLKFISLLMLAALYSLVVLGATMLLIIPGIILAVTLMFSFILVIVENQSVLQTMISSHRLVWGRWWHTFGVMGFLLVVNLILQLAIFVIIAGLGLHQQMHLTPIYFAILLISAIVQALFIPYIFATALILIRDLNIRQV